jgi:hypothetical protein
MATPFFDCGLQISDFGLKTNFFGRSLNPQSAIRNPQ